MNKEVLLVEDNAAIMTANERALASVDCHIQKATTIAEAREHLTKTNPAVIVLDIMLPDGNGVEFLSEIRGQINSIVIFVSALDTKDDMLKGLKAGGNDYITKPYDLDLFREKVRNALRQASTTAAEPSVASGRLVVEPFSLDTALNIAFVGDIELRLTQKEYALLLMLLENPGNIISPDELYRFAWQTDMVGDATSLWKHISNLKKKIEEHVSIETVRILTVKGKGYKMEIAL